MHHLRALLLPLVLILPSVAVGNDAVPLTADLINNADLGAISVEKPNSGTPDPAIVKLEILLDRAGASPGVIDGFDGDNLRKAIRAFQVMIGLDDGSVSALAPKLKSDTPVMGSYTITDKDVSDLMPSIPSDYGEMSKLKFLGYTRVTEELAERFHMDEDLLKAVNPGAKFVAGEQIVVADPGANKEGHVVKLEADERERQLRGYDSDGGLLVAYPATIGSEDNPSPTGTHLVDAIVQKPNYTYDPDVNFKQGNNTEKLIIPPGPNGPVGSVWIDLTEPTFGIHGTPEPSKIDKTNSHGCVRLTNWDAEELSEMVAKGVPVEFTD